MPTATSQIVGVVQSMTISSIRPVIILVLNIANASVAGAKDIHTAATDDSRILPQAVRNPYPLSSYFPKNPFRREAFSFPFEALFYHLAAKAASPPSAKPLILQGSGNSRFPRFEPFQGLKSHFPSSRDFLEPPPSI
jgi:hypothetical protein